VSFSRVAAFAFLESSWQLIHDEPDVWHWSDQFVEAQGAVSGYAATLG